MYFWQVSLEIYCAESSSLWPLVTGASVQLKSNFIHLYTVLLKRTSVWNPLSAISYHTYSIILINCLSFSLISSFQKYICFCPPVTPFKEIQNSFHFRTRWFKVFQWYSVVYLPVSKSQRTQINTEQHCLRRAVFHSFLCSMQVKVSSQILLENIGSNYFK